MNGFPVVQYWWRNELTNSSTRNFLSIFSITDCILWLCYSFVNYVCSCGGRWKYLWFLYAKLYWITLDLLQTGWRLLRLLGYVDNKFLKAIVYVSKTLSDCIITECSSLWTAFFQLFWWGVSYIFNSFCTPWISHNLLVFRKKSKVYLNANGYLSQEWI